MKTNKVKILLFILIITFVILGITSSILFLNRQEQKTKDIKVLEATVTAISSEYITLEDDNKVVYKITSADLDLSIGERLVLEYSGILNTNGEIQEIEVISYKKEPTNVVEDEDAIPIAWQDNGIFKDYYKIAYKKLKEMSIEEKIGQVLVGRYNSSTALSDLEKYHLAGFTLYANAFKDKTKSQVVTMIDKLQEKASIPLIIAIDEEGGTVSRLSSNKNLTTEPFLSPQDLYQKGGFTEIKNDTIRKNKLLASLGINVNLAPVLDIANKNSYIYDRTLGQDTDLTKTFAKTIIETSKNSDVSYVLKHFPGYGNAVDTHTGSATNNESKDVFLNTYIPPFAEGINAGAEAILVNHNLVSSLDSNIIASLSPTIHNILREDLKFTGIIMTDDIDMDAASTKKDAVVQALIAGNNIILTSDYKEAYAQIKEHLDNKTIDEELLDQAVFKVLAWKYYKHLPVAHEKS